MPRPAVGMRPSASCYAPAVPHGLRLCRGGCGEHAFYIRDVRRRVGRSDFRPPAVPRSLRLCRGGCGGPAFYIRAVRRRVGRSDFRAPAVPRGLRLCREGCGEPAFYICDVRRRVRSFFIHYVNFFPDVHIDSFTPHRPPARGHGGGAVFSRRERTIAHGHARTARFGGASGHSRGRICPAPRRGFATLCPLAPSMVGGLGGATAAPDAGAGTRGDFDPPRQPTCRLFRLCARGSCRRRPPSCRQCRHLPPPDADPPRPSCTPPPPSGVGRPRSAHFFPTTPTPLASACFCLGLNVCFIPRKKLHSFV